MHKKKDELVTKTFEIKFILYLKTNLQKTDISNSLRISIEKKHDI